MSNGERKLMEPEIVYVGWEKSGAGIRLKVPNVKVGRSAHVVWRWAESNSTDPFYILFPDGSPFPGIEYASVNGEVIDEIVYDHASQGARKFKYIIAGYRGGVLRILDPEIIVSKPGG